MHTERTTVTRVSSGQERVGEWGGAVGGLRREEFSFQCWEADSEETHKVRLREIL